VTYLPNVKKEKYEKYLLYFGLVSFFICLFGAIAFLLLFQIPSPWYPIYTFQSLLGTITVTFPWLNWLSIIGLILLLAGTFARFLGVAKKNHVPKLFVVAFVICILLTLFTLSIIPLSTNNNYTPPSNQLYPTPTPYQAYAPNPTPTPFPTTDPNQFSITQVYITEFLYDYGDPVAYKTLSSSIQPVITFTATHEIDVSGTYDNWNYDLYVKEQGSGVWRWVASDITGADGNDVYYIPIMLPGVFDVAAFIDPDSNALSPLLGEDLDSVAMANLVDSGQVRSSNILTFEVTSGEVL